MRKSYNKSVVSGKAGSSTKQAISSTEVMTNFSSMIARYRPENRDGKPIQNDKKIGPAKLYKKVLEMPVGKLWFPGMCNNGVNSRAIEETLMQTNQDSLDPDEVFINKVRERANTSCMQYRSTGR